MSHLESILADEGFGATVSSKPVVDRIHDALIALYVRRAALTGEEQRRSETPEVLNQKIKCLTTWYLGAAPPTT